MNLSNAETKALLDLLQRYVRKSELPQSRPLPLPNIPEIRELLDDAEAEEDADSEVAYANPAKLAKYLIRRIKENRANG